MRYTPLALPGAYLVDVERQSDDRGFFARTWCASEFAEHGLASAWVQSSISFNARAGTLRGLHYQAEPHGECKLVRCTRGRLYDVVLDLRPSSPAHLQWVAVELSEEDARAVYVPEGCAHGFQTLAPDTEVLYVMSTPHVAASARGVRWNDPAFGIVWPAAERTISDRDAEFPDFARPT